jgi:hypothetical protein
VLKWLPGVDEEDATAAVEATVNRLKCGYGSMETTTATAVATTITSATVQDVAAQAAAAIAQVKDLQATIDALKAQVEGGAAQ